MTEETRKQLEKICDDWACMRNDVETIEKATQAAYGLGEKAGRSEKKDSNDKG